MKYRTPFLTTAILAAVAVFALIAQAAVLTNGLVGRWIFSETSGLTAYDTSGFNNNATLAGAALFAKDSIRGQILSLTAVSGGATIPYSQRLEPYSGTVSVWVKPTLAVGGDVVRHNTNKLLRCNINNQTYAYALRLNSSGGVTAIFANDDPKSCSRSPQYMISSASNQAPLNKWAFLAATWDGKSTLNLYVNGKLVAKSAYSPNPTYGLSYYGGLPTIVGANTGANLNYIGSVSDLRIYSRALSATEIANVYNGQ